MRSSQDKSELNQRIENLNYDIWTHYKTKKSNGKRRIIKPGCSKSLWDAVKVVKDKNINKPRSGVIIECPLNGLFHERRDIIITF